MASDKKMSVWAETIMKDKYSHIKPDGDKESWEEISSRVARKVLKCVNASPKTVKDVQQLIADKKFMPGGRYLAASGRPFHQTQNCFGGETQIITRLGTRTLSELEGQSVVLMTTNGNWVEAPIRSFGSQELMKVTLSRAGMTKEIWATPEHSWRVAKNETKDGRPATKVSVETKKLKKNQRLWSVFGYGISRTVASLAGIQHGIVYGDGNVPKDTFGFNTANVRLCGEKDAQLLRFFEGYPSRPIDADVEVSGLPRHYKAAPSLESDRSYLLGWLAGYFAADGCVSDEGVVTISSCDEDSLKLVKDVCYILGIGAYGIRYSDRISNLTNEPSRLFSIALMKHTLNEDFFLIDNHKKRFLDNPPKRSECSWIVKSVEKTNRIDKVFCATVDETHEFVLADNILTGNCLLLRAEDSREGWSELMQKITMSLMTGAGIGVVYSDVRGEGMPIRKTGGTSTGPIALMQMVNEAGRGIRQGGSRRSAIWAGLHWNHKDIHKFIKIKNWSEDVVKMKAKDYNFPATMDGTNISVILDDLFFEAFGDESHQDHKLAKEVYWSTVKQMLKTAEPGFSIDVGVNKNENCRNACVAGDTEILTKAGYYPIESLVGKEVEVWNGFEWSAVTPKITGNNREMVTVSLSSGQSIRCTENHTFWLATDYRGGTKEILAKDLEIGQKLMKTEMPVIYEGRNAPYAYTQGFVSGDGMDGYSHFSLYSPKYMCESRLSAKVSKNENNGRKNAKLTFDPHPKNFVPMEWNVSSRLNWFAGLMDSDGTELKEGGAQICSIDQDFLLRTQKMLTTLGITSKVTKSHGAGFKSMPDGKGGTKDYYCQTAYRLLVGSVQMQHLKSLGFKSERMAFDKTPQRDASQFVTVVGVEESGVEETVYCFNEPKRHLGCFEGVVTGQCTEITSHDDSDICNLGSINMAQIESLEDMKNAVELATMFLLAGTIYSDVPYPKVDQVRTKNRRLGLGLMGLHEWLLKKGKAYAQDPELEEYLKIYATSTEIAAKYAKEWQISAPIKTRAIAPTGTIGIVAETTTGIEPVFCVAYKRRYVKDNDINYQYVIDGCAQRLIESGVDPEKIEDAYSLAQNVEKRVQFQHWLQKYVDHAISSTINLPAWGSELNNDTKVKSFGKMLMKYLPGLRGITCYPDGAREGQPLTPIKYSTAIAHVGKIFIEQQDICDLTKGGSCGV